MSKVLLAVATCANHLNRNTACLETWMRDYRSIRYQDIEAHMRLFDGKYLGVPDDYKSLPAKIKAICKYASEKEFDFLFKCDSDTYVFIDRLLGAHREWHDYEGWANPKVSPEKNYASGGAGYWLSRKAFEIVAKAPLTSDTCEDRWVGRILYDAGIRLHRDARYGVPSRWSDPPPERDPFTDHTLLTWHPANPAEMYKLHKAAKGVAA